MDYLSSYARIHNYANDDKAVNLFFHRAKVFQCLFLSYSMRKYPPPYFIPYPKLCRIIFLNGGDYSSLIHNIHHLQDILSHHIQYTLNSSQISCNKPFKIFLSKDVFFYWTKLDHAKVKQLIYPPNHLTIVSKISTKFNVSQLYVFLLFYLVSIKYQPKEFFFALKTQIWTVEQKESLS